MAKVKESFRCFILVSVIVATTLRARGSIRIAQSDIGYLGCIVSSVASANDLRLGFNYSIVVVCISRCIGARRKNASDEKCDYCFHFTFQYPYPNSRLSGVRAL